MTKILFLYVGQMTWQIFTLLPSSSPHKLYRRMFLQIQWYSLPGLLG
jgi:hypothetical protein